MEAMGLGTIIIVLVVMWYLGSSINAVLAGSGEIAEKEFNQFKKQQDVRLFKGKVKMYKQVQKLTGEKTYSDEEWDKIFNPEKVDD
jgi:predicted metalloprotease